MIPLPDISNDWGAVFGAEEKLSPLQIPAGFYDKKSMAREGTESGSGGGGGGDHGNKISLRKILLLQALG